MTTLRLSLHPAQQVIHNSKARFKVVAAGRRFGKTVYAVMRCLIAGLAETSDGGVPLDTTSEVVYIGVDREQAKRNAWNLFKTLGRPVISQTHENTAVITLVNGVRIRLLGMDSPDAARGMKLRYAVLDEYADMPEAVWGEIVRPALMDCKGGALFIGTPKGKNHFYQLMLEAMSGKKNWEGFNFTSLDNPTLDPEELKDVVEEYSGGGSEHLREQEIYAKFIAKGGKIFDADQFKTDAFEPADGTYYMAVDLAGFSSEKNRPGSDLKKRDETAIAIVKVHDRGWWVKEIISGQWDVRETAYRIVKAAMDNEVASVGIEKGALLYAVAPYLEEYTRKHPRRWLNIQPVSHGNKHKWDRIQWALQGRAQRGQIVLNPGDWNEKLIDQAVDFPDRRSRDDLIDALAYIDQIAAVFDTAMLDDGPEDYVPLDAISGY